MCTRRLVAEYVLPLRWKSDDELDDLTGYLTRLSAWIDITVIDDSSPLLFVKHAARWDKIVRHVPVNFAEGVNGKVRGVLTGIELSRHEAIVIADDDVRYERDGLIAVVDDLRAADLVKPQNYFTPLPWHARWDTARTLINRGLSTDYPGTYAVRRSTLVRTGGYDANVLFENLELERTIHAANGTVSNRSDIFIARLPPTVRHFLSQRVRQAYDSFAQPLRLMLEGLIVPIVFWNRRRPVVLGILFTAVLAIAEYGRRRHGGSAVFPSSSILWTPLWLAERGVATWIAITMRFSGGVKYGNDRIKRAANPIRTIQRRLNGHHIDASISI